MRKVERQMNQAIQSGENWAGGNTMVTHIDGRAMVHLHGHLIAEVGEDWIKLYDGGWQSNTTKSRLNAILAEFGLPNERVFQKSWEWFLRMRDGSAIPFFSSMRLA